MFEPAFVVDASVFVADAQPQEPFHTNANLLLETLTAHQCVLYVPAIVLSEIAAAIARGADDPELARQAVGLYRQWPGLRLMPVDEMLGNRAADIAAQQRIRGCDAVYVASAQMEQAILITLDGQQRERAPSGVTARTPAQALAEWFQP
jgi:predicted nucleic acid-binding protein